jgi:hypothetical protein
MTSLKVIEGPQPVDERVDLSRSPIVVGIGSVFQRSTKE